MAATVFVSAIWQTQAAAQTGDVPFSGLILQSCSVIPASPGTLVVNGAGDVLSSDGSVPGTATILATGFGYEVSVDTPLAFDIAPPGGNDDTTFEVDYDLSGITLGLNLLGTVATSLNIGATLISVDATARKEVGIFPAGAYALTATVRCAQP